MPLGKSFLKLIKGTFWLWNCGDKLNMKLHLLPLIGKGILSSLSNITRPTHPGSIRSFLGNDSFLALTTNSKKAMTKPSQIVDPNVPMLSRRFGRIGVSSPLENPVGPELDCTANQITYYELFRRTVASDMAVH